jgi:hypothetical protein
MTPKTFSTTLDEVLGLVEPTLVGIEQGKGTAELLQLEQLLRRALVDLLRLIRRDPGIEAATWDLYGAAVALVRDHGAGELPMARKQRLLREAHRRFRQRLGAACPSEEGIKLVWREPAREGENRSRPSALCLA